MKIHLEIGMSKRDMDYLIEKSFAEMLKQHLSETDRRSVAAMKGWETRREKSKN